MYRSLRKDQKKTEKNNRGNYRTRASEVYETLLLARDLRIIYDSPKERNVRRQRQRLSQDTTDFQIRSAQGELENLNSIKLQSVIARP